MEGFEGTVIKVFVDGQGIEIRKDVTTNDEGEVIDRNGNGYVKIPHVGKVTKIETAENTKGYLNTVFEADASNTSVVAIMKNKDKGANAVLRTDNGSISTGIYETKVEIVDTGERLLNEGD